MKAEHQTMWLYPRNSRACAKAVELMDTSNSNVQILTLVEEAEEEAETVEEEEVNDIFRVNVSTVARLAIAYMIAEKRRKMKPRVLKKTVISCYVLSKIR